MDNMKHRRLQELDHSDFEIVKGEPDIRGWDVRTAEGKKIGEVEDLIVDAQQKKVRYMVVELDDDDLDLEDDKRVLIPIGLAELHNEVDDVLLPSVTVEQLRNLPGYDKDHLDDETERTVCNALGRREESGFTRSQTITSPEGINSTTDHTDRATGQTGGTTSQHQSTDARQENSTSEGNTNQPALGTSEYYGNFYQHSYFSDYNLYKNRQQEGKSEQLKEESDYERGLRLWELRSEGGIIGSDASGSGENNREREISTEKRREMIENRRKQYEDRRGNSKDNTIIQRIKDEGLKDA